MNIKKITFWAPLFCLVTAALSAAANALPSWNEGPVKQAIIEFVRATTDPASKNFVPLEERIATFDQDGTLWVEQPSYTQVMYCLDQVKELVARKPALRDVEPYKTVLAGKPEEIAKFSHQELAQILEATLTGMSVEVFTAQVKRWLATARHPRWNRLYTELTYQPMLEFIQYLRANGYRPYLVTGGGQDFVRAYADKVYGIPPEQVIGTAGGTRFEGGSDGASILIKEAKLLLNDNFAGKPEGIHFMIGRRPYMAAGNSTGDQQMLEYTGGGMGSRLMLLIMHDDAQREYAYGPAQGLPNSKVGTFSQDLYDEAKVKGWFVVSMKNDWKRIFAFEKQ